MYSRKIESALISVFYKDGLAPIAKLLHEQGVKLYSTGGTQTFLQNLQLPVTAVENLTGYPSILGGRVKTLHPKVFGGILFRREEAEDQSQVKEYDIPSIDLVIVDLYPFEETLASGAGEEDIIEKIDIGGISLIRGAAKNFRDVLIVSSRNQYADVESLLREKNCTTDLADRKKFAALAFEVTSHYDTAIFNYFNNEAEIPVFKQSLSQTKKLRYGENPHQAGYFHGDLEAMFEQLHGKELSYNNLVDIDAAVLLINEFEGDKAFAILKHTNACGAATASTVKEAYLKALAADPVSAFGGVLITNSAVDKETAEELNKLFFEVLVAPSFTEEALQILKGKKNRILLKRKEVALPSVSVKTLLNGVIRQDIDNRTESPADLRSVTQREVTTEEKDALVFAAKIAKHTKSNTIVLAKKGQLLASGVGQTSRVDALRQAIEKAKSFGFDLQGAVMASDAFFPFPDCVEIAHKVGIQAIVQPGGSVKDQDSIDYCNSNGLAMAFTGIRHFKH
ncbi:bifunctional phosphoribosylaminoimidazolecarboxamide formyltransferase/IMP cyclohydrolase [Rhodocytophaga aerolata]|uniref:Bifunctional purine biosynthesis protein PurH n=1 Tax=Rhodocytophaga aerolata TaxID=455078 RepID=A0ABT8R8Y4_9BACT|nr:bifunctional phosphoribosylaminoimidazolecarboxamide formyltransferase/IMP cyclohydrolase [Rhodocytophaga aerolata]MDO1448537.1 bifunctional phosphoribosylaminoimidazolecarboxamide formyltransferase/IMP cyclohydrolase [Rhodocytophaga aerolata]